MRATPATAADIGAAAEVTLGFDEAACHLFAADGERIEPRGASVATAAIVPLRA